MKNEKDRSVSDSGRRLISSYTPKLAGRKDGENLPFVRDFVDFNVAKLPRTMQVHDAMGTLLERGITSAAVVDEEGNLIGILSEKDCLRTVFRAAYHGLPAGGMVEEYMSTDVDSVTLDTDIMTVVAKFLQTPYRRLVVLDEHKKLVGQVTRRDLLRVFHKILAENGRITFF